MGGLIATGDKWQVFTAAWQEALDEFIGGKPFHMKDYICVPGIGVYAGWDEDKRRKFFAKLVSAIALSEAQLVGCVVSNNDFSLLSAKHQAILGDPYFLCFQQVTHGFSILGIDYDRISEDDLFAGEKVAMIYAYQKEFGAVESGSNHPENQGRAEKLWHAMKAKGRFGHLMGLYSSELASNICALQAADLFAYEITKEFENAVSRPKDPMRWRLEQLLKYGCETPLIKYYGFHILIEALMDGGFVPENADMRLASSLMQLNVKMDMTGRSGVTEKEKFDAAMEKVLKAQPKLVKEAMKQEKQDREGWRKAKRAASDRAPSSHDA